MSYHRYRRDRTEVSCWMKYVIFSFNVIFWIIGFLILCVGVWAWTEKDKFNNLSRMTHVPLDPAFLLIVVGTITFMIGFAGCVGALRENTCLLAFYSISLFLLLLLEIAACIVCLTFKDWFKEQAISGFRTYIVGYTEDDDQKNVVDWLQGEWLRCCGIYGPNDWDQNEYYNCSSGRSSTQTCGVPSSCCNPEEELMDNTQCGFGARRNNLLTDDIYQRGCLAAGEAWVDRNFMMVFGVFVFIFFLQILGVCFAQNMRADIFAQMSKWW